jgi:hypothetical protein
MTVRVSLHTTAAFGLIAALGLAASASADVPTLGGPMVHIDVGFDGAALSVHKGSSDTLVLHMYPGETYDAPADCLNETMYNAQYGWVIAGAWTRPEGTTLWIEELDATPGLNVYAARTSASPYAPIFGTAGSPELALWNGMMAHNWYSTLQTGRYQATYRIYLGDASGNPADGYAAAEVRLDWTTGLPCIADFDGSGTIAVSDIFAYLSAWFAGDARADLGSAPGNDVPDLFQFLSAWFGGCA